MVGLDRSRGIRDEQRAEWGAVAPGWQRNREKMAGPTSTITEKMLSLAGISAGQRVLDLACGVGDPAFAIAGLVGPGGYVLGLDLSPQMIEAARELSSRERVNNVEFRTIASELELGVPGESFDVATCRLGLMFMPDPVAALQEMRAALRPGGRVVASVWGAPERNPNFSVPMEIIARHADLTPQDADAPGLFAIPNPEKLETLLREAGFVDVEAFAFETPVVKAKDAESYWYGVSNVAGPLVSILASLSEEQRRAVHEDVVEVIGGKFPDGPVEIDGEAVVAAGTRPS
jgi:SAM-dependent methyltransferase